MTPKEERFRGDIIGAINLLAAQDFDAILSQFPGGARDQMTERLLDRLHDHLRVAVGLKPLWKPAKPGTFLAAVDAVADRLLAERDRVIDAAGAPMKTGGKKKARRR
mgnify:CR=1 FL=1